MVDNTRKNKIFTIKKVINQKKWSNEEDEQLIKIVKENNEKNWKKISSYFQNKNPLQCFSRYKRIKPGIRRGFWRKEEDELILSLIKKYGKNWSKISHLIKTRNGKQIRDRYINILAPNINKTKFSEEEDNLLLRLYKKFGPKWSKIHNYFKGRTTDMIKNRFHSTLKRKFENKDFINKNNINKNSNNNVNIKEYYSTEPSICNNKESSTISLLSYPPSSFCNQNEKEDRNIIDNQNNNIFNNDYFNYNFDDEESL